MPLRFIQNAAERGFGAVEVVIIAMIVFTVDAFAQTPAAIRARNPIFQRMESLAPLWCWYAVVIGALIALLAGIVIRRPLVSVAGYLVIATWMAILCSFGLLDNPHRLAVEFFAAPILGSVWRAGDLSASYWTARR